MADVDDAVSAGHTPVDDSVAIIDAELCHHISGGSEINDIDVARGGDGSDGRDPGDPDDADTSSARVDGDNHGDGIELADGGASIAELCRHERAHPRRPTTPWRQSDRRRSPDVAVDHAELVDPTDRRRRSDDMADPRCRTSGRTASGTWTVPVGEPSSGLRSRPPVVVDVDVDPRGVVFARSPERVDFTERGLALDPGMPGHTGPVGAMPPSLLTVTTPRSPSPPSATTAPDVGPMSPTLVGTTLWGKPPPSTGPRTPDRHHPSPSSTPHR